MKYFFALMILFISVHNSFPQSNPDSVDIKKIVAEQIATAQVKSQEIQVEEKDIPVPQVENSSFNSTGLKSAAGLMVLLWAAYVWIKKEDKKKEKISELQNFPEKENSDIQIIRTRLMDSMQTVMGDDDISRTARKLKIGKGELYLAAILKAKELNKLAGSRIL